MTILREPMGVKYFNDIQSIIGNLSNDWQRVIIKETLDNSLDEIAESHTKEISITHNDNLFSVCDTGRGIPEEAFEHIYNFNERVSEKHLKRRVARGYMGDALKIIIALCWINHTKLYFVTNGKRISFEPDTDSIKLGILENAFNRTDELTERQNGIYIETKIDKLWDYLTPYMVVNPDVTFIVNGKSYPAQIRKRRSSAVCSIHWHDSESFAELLTRTAIIYPTTTTKQFVQQFSGVNHILKNLILPGKQLQDFYKDKIAMKALFKGLREKIVEPQPDVLRKYQTGKELVKKMCAENFIRYHSTIGTYEINDAKIPYIIEVFTEKMPEPKMWELGTNTVTTCINNSKNYEDMPFRFNNAKYVFAGCKIENNSLHLILNKAKFFDGQGCRLFIHVISPYHQFCDSSKSEINVEKYQNDLLATIESVVMPILEAIKSGEQSGKKERKRNENKKISKKKLMLDYFMEGAKLATGDWQYTTTVRMVFYAVRKLITNINGITLNGKKDFDNFTQSVATEMFDLKPDLQDIIYFERRGLYLDLESGKEMPIHTVQIKDFIKDLNDRAKCDVRVYEGIYIPSKSKLIYPIELTVSAILFVEKQGLLDIFKESKILDELNLGLICSQGFATRAMKTMIDDFISRGIKVYVLTDCDLAGQLIAERIAEGSSTYKDKLKVNYIGLTHADARELDKISDAEEYNSTKSYINVLDKMTDDEKNFFLKEEVTINGVKHFKYRRVELNALTVPELLSFIRSKIPKTRIRPTREQITTMISFDPDILKRDVIINHLLKRVDEYIIRLSDTDIMFDKEAIIEKIDRALDAPSAAKRWQDIFEFEIKKIVNQLIKQIDAKMPSN